MSLTLLVGNSTVMELAGLINTVTQVYDNAATVTVSLSDWEGNAVTGGDSWPALMGYVDASNGTYRRTLDAGINIQPWGRYKATISAVGSGGEVAQWTVPVTAVEREG